jgi:hypothetical protein
MGKDDSDVLTSFETTHCDKSLCHLMVVERQAMVDMRAATMANKHDTVCGLLAVVEASAASGRSSILK